MPLIYPGKSKENPVMLVSLKGGTAYVYGTKVYGATITPYRNYENSHFREQKIVFCFLSIFA